MITVRAYQSFDGSGVYEIKGRLYLTGPPYDAADARHVASGYLDYLAIHLGYELVNVPCESLTEVHEYLKARSKEWVNPHGNAVLDEAVMTKGIGTLSEDNLLDLIGYLREEFDTKGGDKEVRLAVSRLWKVGKVMASDRLSTALLDLEARLKPFESTTV